MKNDAPLRIKTISEYHKLRGLPAPEHPLISVIDYAKMKVAGEEAEAGMLFDFYLVAIKRGMDGKMYYGQQAYDFDEGIMFFMAPHQLLKLAKQSPNSRRTGWMLLIHPDFLWSSSLATMNRQYEFFDYAVHEALFLSKKEEATLHTLAQQIKQEYQLPIDKFSQPIIISQLETLLNYGERYYQRQFITRKKTNHAIVQRIEKLLQEYFDKGLAETDGIPSVQYVADQLHISSSYLGSLLKSVTGLNTQQHIHEQLIAKAKQQLSTTQLSVSEIAFALGFEHSQSFSKLFKTKTNQTPLDFRKAVN